MKVSIITPSFLGKYRNAAEDRERKLIRAVRSALLQEYADIEVIVIADGCELTMQIIKEWFREPLESGKLRLIQIPKQKPFSGDVRNAGIEAATGDLICYLDADDFLGADHVSTIVKGFTGDWVWFNDMILKGDNFEERTCSLKLGFCGTSNIAHKRSMAARWHPVNTYGRDDWNFILELLDECPHGARIETPAYIVCHIPYKRGYDV